MYKLIPLVAATLLSAAAMAGDKPKDSTQSTDATFKSLDRNADERLSQTEVATSKELSSQFAALDTDADGFLTKREFTAAHAKPDKQGRDY